MSLARPSLCAPMTKIGVTDLAIRFSLGIGATLILAFGLFRHPEIAATHGERVAGLILTLGAAAGMFVSAACFPMAVRIRR